MTGAVRKGAETVLPVATLLAFLAAIYMVFEFVPTARGEGVVQRIFYFHVPLATLTYVAFGTVAVASALFLWRGAREWDRLAHASAEIGMLFCTLVLFTGMMWARPRWNVWWTWDARLTSTLILWLIYAGYLMLRGSVGPTEPGARYAAILGIVGAVDIPIINRSVYWWRTIHPAVITTREGGSGLADPRMQATLGVCMVAFVLLYLWLLWMRYEGMRLHDRVETLRQEALRAPRAVGHAA
jgi:heme exporter protein C